MWTVTTCVPRVPQAARGARGPDHGGGEEALRPVGGAACAEPKLSVVGLRDPGRAGRRAERRRAQRVETSHPHSVVCLGEPVPLRCPGQRLECGQETGLAPVGAVRGPRLWAVLFRSLGWRKENRNYHQAMEERRPLRSSLNRRGGCRTGLRAQAGRGKVEAQGQCLGPGCWHHHP